MRVVKGFTLIELLVVIAIIAMLLAILLPGLKRVKEQGKRITCLSNLRQMMLSWEMYAEENDGKIANGNTSLGPWNTDDDCWVYWPGQGAPEQERIEGIEAGQLFPYCQSYTMYKCPTGMREELVTFAIVDSMNGYDAIPGAGEIIKNKSQINSPAVRVVFLDEGRLSPSSWTIFYDQEKWWDQITARHGNGTDLSFADGHSEYWKWTDERTLAVCNADFDEWQNSLRFTDMAFQPGNKDLHRVQRGVWSKLGYTPSAP